jgi:CSLREA domain-containing protein
VLDAVPILTKLNLLMKTKSLTLSAFCNPRMLAAFVICLAALLGFFAFVARATPPVVITVNTLVDEITPGDGLCSLREAIINANDNAQTFPECAAGTGANAITFSISGTITLGSTLPAITDDVTIDGGAQSITVSGNNSVRVMIVNSGKTLTLLKLTIANGLSTGAAGGGIYDDGGTVNVINSTFSGNSASGDGGGILNNGGTVSVTNSTFSGNSSSTGAVGGGISNENGGTVNVTNSTFSGNSAGHQGGGIFNFGGIANVANSTFSGNSVSNSGGGLYNNSGTMNVTNSTFSGNNGGFAGGGLLNADTLNVTNSTFSGNSAGRGGGLVNDIGTTTLKNTIIANSTSGGNCNNTATLTADSHNLADDGTCGGATVATSAQINLQPLANNGGPTQTMALGPGSVAIDAGDESACAAPPVNEFDQRGVTRPRDGDGDGIAICDTGSYEAPALTPTPTPIPPRPTPTPRPHPTRPPR